jgi:hypothetical protein
VQNALIEHARGIEVDFLRQYWANVAGRQGEEDWFSPQVFTGAADYLEVIKGAGGPLPSY